VTLKFYVRRKIDGDPVGTGVVASLQLSMTIWASRKV
jgi:hypothetical protein